MWAHTKNTHQRGYGRAHRNRRIQLLPFAYGKPCPMCGKTMSATDKLDLDHSTPLALGGLVGDRIVHRSCNQLAGSKLGHEMQRRKRSNPSRAW